MNSRRKSTRVYKNLSLKEINNLALVLAKKYSARDTVIGLIGELGAGKTAFVKGFAKFYKIKKIKSPTFIIFGVYPTKKKLLYHFDFYRLHKQSELKHLGFDEILRQKNRIILIEWVDKFPKIKTKANLILKFEITGKNLRNVTIY
jgi:tRNA threonylcarbamoyladenosine biosynthesis protein TsaE